MGDRRDLECRRRRHGRTQLARLHATTADLDEFNTSQRLVGALPPAREVLLGITRRPLPEFAEQFGIATQITDVPAISTAPTKSLDEHRDRRSPRLVAALRSRLSTIDPVGTQTGCQADHRSDGCDR